MVVKGAGKRMGGKQGWLEGRTGCKLCSGPHQIRVIERRNGPLIRTDDRAYFCSYTSAVGRYGTRVIGDPSQVSN